MTQPPSRNPTPSSAQEHDQADAAVLRDARPFEPTASGRWLTRETAQRALDRALPGIAAQAADPEVCGTGFLHIVLMDPGLPPGTASFEDAILLEHSIGDRSQWDADYARYARAKAQFSWRHGVDGHMPQSRYPYLVLPGETSTWGGVCLDGIVVGVSGAHPWFDEAFGLTLAAHLRAEIKRLAATRGGADALVVPTDCSG